MSVASLLQSSSARPLPLRRRADLRATPLEFRGTRYWTVSDPLAMRYFQLNEEEHFVLMRLDGVKSLEQIVAEFRREFPSRVLRVEQLQAFLGRLYQQGLLVSSMPGQGIELARLEHEQRRARSGGLGKLLAWKFRGVDPSAFLDFVAPLVRPLLQPLAVALGVAMMIGAALLAFAQTATLGAELSQTIQSLAPRDLVWLALAISLTKILHELGHAITARHYGVPCHELGVMLLLGLPCLYCNVSGAWLLPSKWQRIAVSAAGVYVDLLLAALATFGWWFSEPGAAHTFCLSLMVVGSVNSLLVNGNPLLRFDGYYIFSDLIEVPNLAQRASFAARRLALSWLGGVSIPDERLGATAPSLPLALYAVTAWMYRLLLMLGVVWLLHRTLEPHGLDVLAVAVLVLLLLATVTTPAKGLAESLRAPSVRRRLRPPRVLAGFAVLAVVVGAVLMIPLPGRVLAPAAIAPAAAPRVYVTTPGRLIDAVAPGAVVTKGQVLARLSNNDLDRELAAAEGEVERLAARVKALSAARVINVQASVELPTAQQALVDAQARLEKRREQRERLTLRAPVAGRVISARGNLSEPSGDKLPTWSGDPLSDENRGALLTAGTVLCRVAETDRFVASVLLDQADVEFVRAGQSVELRLAEFPGMPLTGVVEKVAEHRFDDDGADPLIGDLRAHGLLPPERSQGPKGQTLGFVATAPVEPTSTPLIDGAAGDAKISIEARSLGQRFYRWLSATLRLQW